MYLGGRISRLLIGVAVLFGVIGMGAFAMNRPVSAAPGINEHLNFQGRLYNAQGAIVPDGYYNLQFKIYQDGTGTSAGNPGGTLEWTEEWLNDDGNGVQIKNGYLSVELGSVTPFGSSVDWNQDTLWLSMNIGNTNGTCTPFTSCSGDGEMLPMKRLSSAVYALNAGQLGGLNSSQFVQLAQGVQTDASTNTTSIYLNKTGGGNFLELQSSSTDVFTLSNSGDIEFGANNDHTISVATAGAATGGYDLTVSAGTGGSGTGSAGGDLVLQGGAAGGTDGNGGNVVINAGAKTGTGTDGTISLGTSNTSAINIGADTTIAAGKSLTITGSGTRPSSPTDGMVYYDTTTDQLLVYTNGKWQADRSTTTKMVAANNSSQALKDAADYVADGTADQSEINSALSAAAGGTVYLAEGTYVASGTILIPNNTTLAGASSGTTIELADLDATDNLIENSDSTPGNATPGSGVVIRDLKLDGRSDLNTAGTQYGVYFNDMGSGTGATAVQGSTINNLRVTRFRNDGVYLTASSNNTITNSNFRNNGAVGMSINASSNNNVISNNRFQGNGAEGFVLSSSSYNNITNNNSEANTTLGMNFTSGGSRNTITGNNLNANGTSGIRLSGETRSSIVGNTIRGGGGSTYGMYLLNSTNNNAISSNNVYDTGSAGHTNGFFLDVASYNNITNNVIGDSSCTTTCYAININNAGATNNYLASNNMDSGASIRDTGTGTIKGGQTNSTFGYEIQASAGISLQNDTTVTGSLTATTSVLAPTIDTAAAGTLTIGGTNATAITLADDTTVSADLTVTSAGTVAFQKGSDYSTTGQSDDVNFGNGTIFRLTGASTQTITGIAGGVDGRILTLVNAAGQAASIENESASSSAANRIITGTGANVSLAAGSSLSLVYDSSDSRWRIVGSAGATTGSYIQLQGSTPGSAQTGNFNISGTGIADILQGTTSVLSPLIDVASAGTLSIGTGTATAISIGQAGVTTTVEGDLTVDGATTLNDDLSVASGKTVTVNGDTRANITGYTPAAGMITYDTTNNQLLTYNGTKWMADGKDAILVAASDSSQADKDAANYVADGTADDVEIQAALDAADPSGGTRKTGKVYLFAGTYNVSTSINIKNNTTLAGSGRGTLLSLISTTSAVKVLTNNDTTTGTGVTIQNLRIDGNNGTVGAQYGIYLDAMGGGTGASARQGAKVNNVVLTNFNTANLYLNASSHGTFSGISSQGSDGDGIALSTSNYNTFTGNTLSGNTGDGFDISNSNSNTFSANTIQNNSGSGLSTSTSSYNLDVSGNTFRQNGTNGITMNQITYSTISNNAFYNNTGDGINVVGGASSSLSITGNSMYNNTGDGIDLTATHTSITGNTLISNTNGIIVTNSYNQITGNITRSNSNAGISLNGSSADDNTVSGNTVSANTVYGIYLSNADTNSISGNRILDNGGLTTNNGIYLTASDSNSIQSNAISDSNASSNNYSINIFNSTSDTNYLSDNTLGTGSVNDSGTNTRYGGQVDASGNYRLQPAGTIELQANTNVTGTLTATTALQAPLLDTSSATALNIGTTNATQINLNKNTTLVGNLTLDSAANRTISIGTSAASTAGSQLTIAAGTGGSGSGSIGGDLVLQGGAAGGTNANGGSVYLDAGAKTGSGTNGTIAIGTVAASTIQIGSTTLSSGTQTINIGNNNTSGGTTNVVIGSGGSATAGTTTIQAKDGISILTNGITRQTFDNTNSVYFGNGVTAASPNNFTISGTGSSTSGTAGGSLTIQGGNATTGNANGGNLTLSGGTGVGSGANGLVILTTPTFQTVANDANCYTGGSLVASTCTMDQDSIDNSSAILVGFNTLGQTANMPDPTITTAGRIVYVTAANGSEDFTLSVNGGGTGNTIAMRENTTATMIWNGADWTAAGASSSTTLQSAYDNTLQSAGGAELVVSSTGSTNGLTIRDSSTNPVDGRLLSVQTSSAADLISVNSNVTEYASNAGAETQGASSSTFPASTWSAITGATVSRYTTAGDYIATGQGSVSVATSTSALSGVKNQLSTTLTAGNTYNVSMTTRLSSGTFTDLEVYYSIDGSASSTQCTNAKVVNTSIWTKVNCTFTAPSSGITSGNAIFIRQTGSGTARTFYVDNLSVTIAADFNLASDGSVNSALGTNWTAVSGAGVARSTTYGYDASDSVAVTATGTAGDGTRNKLSINPLTSTLYRITVYAASSNTFNDLTIRYSRDGGSNFDNCVDYNTQSVSTTLTSFTKITCYVTTSATAATDPYVYFTQGSGPARTFYIDAFNMTLSTAVTPNVQIGGGINGGPVTLLTLDRAASAPIAANNDAFLGSMYYDTTLGKLQCYEADGWGACGSSPDNIITISPEYTNAVLHGTGIGTMTSDLCSDTLNINDGSSGQATICGTNETYNFYKWTSPQSTAQTYSIYVTYQLPETFKTFQSGQTSLMGRTDSSNSSVSYQVYKSSSSGLTACGSSVSVSTGSQSSWQTGVASGTADPSTCGFTADDSIVFKIDTTASQNANAYVGNLNFTFSNK